MGGYIPSAVEFMDRDAADCSLAFIDNPWMTIDETVQAYLLIEVDGNDTDSLMKDIEGITTILASYDCGDVLFAEDAAQKEKIWKLRKCIGEALRFRSVYKDEDTVVPRAELPVLLKGVKEIGTLYGFKTVCCGHAGDGNMHVSILKEDLTEEQWLGPVKEGIREIFHLVKRLNGTISAEHGIGLVQKEYLDIVFDKTQMRLMRDIKKVFDPNNILNAGKIFD